MPTLNESITFARMSPIHLRIQSISLSVLVSILLLAVKFYGYRLTGSAAILSDALESIINVIASTFALISIWLASRPPDASHPYGHGKIESFSAGFEGALILLAAIGIFMTAVPRIVHPVPLPHLDAGMLLILSTAVVNAALGTYLLHVGKKTKSLTLIADGKHVLTDVYSTAGVLVGLVLVQWTGWREMDGLTACMVGVNILVSGLALIRKAFSGLMNAADPELLSEISRVISSKRREHWIDIHQLRAWTSGSFVHIDFHLILPKDFSLEQAHIEGKLLEKALQEHFGGEAGVLIHLDPCLDLQCPICARFACPTRTIESTSMPLWTLESMTKDESSQSDQQPPSYGSIERV